MFLEQLELKELYVFHYSQMRGFAALGVLGFLPAFSYLKYQLVDRHNEEAKRIEKEREEAENDRKAR